MSHYMIYERVSSNSYGMHLVALSHTDRQAHLKAVAIIQELAANLQKPSFAQKHMAPKRRPLELLRIVHVPWPMDRMCLHLHLLHKELQWLQLRLRKPQRLVIDAHLPSALPLSSP